MAPTVLSVIRVQEKAFDDEKEENRNNDSTFGVKDIIKAIGISVFGIIGFSLVFCIPWTTIPRTNSIIYQSYWMEYLWPQATNCFLIAGSHMMKLATWTKEDVFMSVRSWMKMYIITVGPWIILHISSYLIWSVYMQMNHPMPNGGLIVYWLNYFLFLIGIPFIANGNLLAPADFPKKMKIYTLFLLWNLMRAIQFLILISFFNKFPSGFQFPVAFIIAGCREVDKRVQSKLVTKMMGVKDHSANALLVINVSTIWSFFIAVRLVGAEFATMICTVCIDFILHSKMAYKIIKDFKQVDPHGEEIEYTERNSDITKVILAELIEGFAPIIYGAAIAMAYFGPNANILSTVGNDYWGKKMDGIGSLFETMFALFAFDTLSATINSFCLWKFLNVNMLKEICKSLERYWFFMAITLAVNISVQLSTQDINAGIDKTRSFKWISIEGWIDLVNNSIDITYEEKKNLIGSTTLFQNTTIPMYRN